MTEGRGRVGICVTPVFVWPRTPGFRIKSGTTVGGELCRAAGGWSSPQLRPGYSVSAICGPVEVGILRLNQTSGGEYK